MECVGTLCAGNDELAHALRKRQNQIRPDREWSTSELFGQKSITAMSYVCCGQHCPSPSDVNKRWLMGSKQQKMACFFCRLTTVGHSTANVSIRSMAPMQQGTGIRRKREKKKSKGVRLSGDLISVPLPHLHVPQTALCPRY
jgi:hypothetical protein